MLTYGTVCSGIGAPEVAWAPLGWRCAFMAEIEAFPRAVLAHHYPEVPLHGDFTTIKAGRYAAVDVLCGGTPCQSFSIAGLRGGLGDARGNLALEYLRLAERLRPRWLVWENVPGVRSSGDGRDFGAFLGGLGELGYGWAYRSLDAQYAGLAQRRERVFVVGHLGDWRRAAEVLFEPASLRGDSAPGREAGQGVAVPVTPGSVGGSGYRLDPDTTESLIAATLRPPSHGAAWRGDGSDNLVAGTLGANHGNIKAEQAWTGQLLPIVSPALKARDHKGPSSDGDGDGACLVPLLVHALRADGFDASEDGTGRGTPLVPIAFNSREDPCATGGVTGALGSSSPQAQAVATAMAVRRLTPRECERLQGFPDDYTLIPWRRALAPDGPRYKALGNAMAVPVVRWIGQRIAAVDVAPPAAVPDPDPPQEATPP